MTCRQNKTPINWEGTLSADSSLFSSLLLWWPSSLAFCHSKHDVGDSAQPWWKAEANWSHTNFVVLLYVLQVTTQVFTVHIFYWCNCAAKPLHRIQNAYKGHQYYHRWLTGTSRDIRKRTFHWIHTNSHAGCCFHAKKLLTLSCILTASNIVAFLIAWLLTCWHWEHRPICVS